MNSEYPSVKMSVGKTILCLMVGLFVTALGALIFVDTIEGYWKDASIKKHRAGTSVYGHVVEKSRWFSVHDERVSFGRYMVKYNFQLPNGQFVYGQHDIDGREWRGLEDGDEIFIAYLLANPRRSFPMGGDMSSFNRIIFRIIFCAVLVFFGALIVYRFMTHLIWSVLQVFRKKSGTSKQGAATFGPPSQTSHNTSGHKTESPGNKTGIFAEIFGPPKQANHNSSANKTGNPPRTHEDAKQNEKAIRLKQWRFVDATGQPDFRLKTSKACLILAIILISGIVGYIVLRPPELRIPGSYYAHQTGQAAKHPQVTEVKITVRDLKWVYNKTLKRNVYWEEGLIENISSYPVSKIKLRANLYDRKGNLFAVAESFAGNRINDQDLKSMSEAEIAAALNESPDSQSPAPPGGKISFMIVYPKTQETRFKMDLRPVDLDRHSISSR